MSRLCRLLQLPPAGRRQYSFFSSRSGGRYFNAPKPPKSVEHSPPSSDSAKPELQEAQEDLAPPPPADSLHYPLQSSTSPLHPIIKPHELKLHHFFSLHRPLLLLDQPTSSLFDATPSSQPQPPSVATIDNPPEASPEADADAARQLSRAIIMNHVGNIVDWNVTLRRLGHDADVGRLEEALQSSATYIQLDSTKRKRRRKMKQHKLKKRRRLQRAQNRRLKR